jgi:hypothetical protein
MASWSVDALDSSGQKVRVCVSIVGAIVTVFFWIIHLHYPSLLEGAPEFLWTLAVLVVFAVPFLTVLSAAYSLFPDDSSQAPRGSMSGYLRGERERKRWKIMVLSGMVSAINLFGMAIVNGS